MLGKEGIPEDAMTLFDRDETLHQWVSNMNLATEW